MGSVDDIGEATVRFLSRAYYSAIGVLIWLIKTSRQVSAKLGENIKIYPYFEGRNVEFKDYVVLKVQMATLVFLAGSIGFIFGFLGTRVLVLLGTVSAYTLYVTHAQLKEHFSSDYPAYRTFFLSYFAISVLLVVVRFAKPTVNFVFPYFHLLVISGVSVFAASYLFKRKYGRKYTFGRVTKGGDFITVKVNYDLLSSVKPGIHTFENKDGVKEGDVVKILVESHGLNIGGSRVVGLMPSD